MIRAIIISIIILLTNVSFCYASSSTCIDIEHGDVDNIYIEVSDGHGNGSPKTNDLSYLKRHFELYIEQQNTIEYIIHYINSLSLTDDGISLGGGDIPVVNIRLTTGNSKEEIGFIRRRFYNVFGKQFSVPKEEYDRFIEFVYAIKVQNLIINDYPAYDISNWATNYVEEAKQTGLLPQWNQIDYKIDINRLEVCQLISNLLKIKGYESADNDSYPFEDIDDKAVKELYYIGMVEGKTKSCFFPYDQITREEFSKILDQTYEYIADSPKLYKSDLCFTDKDEISDWAVECVGDMASLDIIKGYDDGRFDPKGNITKEQVIVMLLRLYNSI